MACFFLPLLAESLFFFPRKVLCHSFSHLKRLLVFSGRQKKKPSFHSLTRFFSEKHFDIKKYGTFCEGHFGSFGGQKSRFLDFSKLFWSFVIRNLGFFSTHMGSHGSTSLRKISRILIYTHTNLNR